MGIKEFIHRRVANNYNVGKDINGNIHEVKCSDNDTLQNFVNSRQLDLAATRKSLENCLSIKGDLLGQLQNSTSQDKKDIAALTDKLSMAVQENVKLAETVRQLSDTPGTSEYLSALLTEEAVAKISYYYKKYSEAYITYSGRTYPGTQKQYEMQVQNWAADGLKSPELISFVKINKLSVKEMMQEKACSYHRACDFVLIKIKHALNNLFKYDFDINTTGVDEYWKFPIETYKSAQNNIGSDCEDYSFLNYALCVIAGIPQGLLRISAGMTYSGIGHATNYYLASNLTWKHCNSTSSVQDITDALQLPDTSSEEPGGLGLKVCWFSFNHERSFSSFNTAAHEETYDKFSKHNLIKNIKIVWKYD